MIPLNQKSTEVSPGTHLSRSRVTLLRERDVADALVVRIHLEVATVGDVVKVLDVLITEDVNMHLSW